MPSLAGVVGYELAPMFRSAEPETAAGIRFAPASTIVTSSFSRSKKPWICASQSCVWAMATPLTATLSDSRVAAAPDRADVDATVVLVVGADAAPLEPPPPHAAVRIASDIARAVVVRPQVRD